MATLSHKPAANEKDKWQQVDEREQRIRALTLAVQNREPDDTGSGERQIKRAERYLAFISGSHLNAPPSDRSR